MSDIFVRAFSDNYSKHKDTEHDNQNPNFRMIIDTETTTDRYQNLNFGSCLIQTKTSNGFKENWHLFYGNIPEDKREIIKEYGREHNIDVLPVREFVDKIFYPYAFRMRCEVIGFDPSHHRTGTP